MKKVRLHYTETEELACKLCGLDYDEIDADTEKIEEAFFDKFNIDLEQFHEIVEHLLPLVEVGKSPLTGDVFKGFSDGNGMWLTKIKVNP